MTTKHPNCRTCARGDQLGHPIHMGQHSNTLVDYAVCLTRQGLPEDDVVFLLDLRGLMDCRPAWGSSEPPEILAVMPWRKLAGESLFTDGSITHALDAP